MFQPQSYSLKEIQSPLQGWSNPTPSIAKSIAKKTIIFNLEHWDENNKVFFYLLSSNFYLTKRAAVGILSKCPKITSRFGSLLHKPIQANVCENQEVINRQLLRYKQIIENLT
jgi:hypothetical protein